MAVTFEAKLKTEKWTNSKGFIVLVVGFFGGFMVWYGSMQEEVRVLLLVVAGIVMIIGLLFLSEITIIKISGKELIIERNILGKARIKRYLIDKIENLNYRRNVKSNFYTSHGSVRIFGVDRTPESWKKYYYHKEVIRFYYEGNRVQFGKWKNAFGGASLVEELRRINPNLTV